MKQHLTNAAILLGMISVLAACDEAPTTAQQETQETQEAKGTTDTKDESAVTTVDQLVITQVPIVPGGGEPVDIEPAEAKKFDGVPEQIAAGRQLFQAYNCVGCHFNGGGGMGPPLMDDAWIYGSSMENIAASIIEGRPAGMPTFRHMVAGDQVWQLAAYVRSLSGLGQKQGEKAEAAE